MIPPNHLYARTHEWLEVTNQEAVVGITDFAQHQLGDLTFIELPAVGATFQAGDEIGTVESVKAASEIYAPAPGEVVAVNGDLEDSPELVNQDPYGKGWMVRMRLSADPSGLMSASEYQEFIAEQE